jgi:hypothetical protein
LVAAIADDIIVIIMSVITIIASKLLKIFGKQLLG